MASEEVRFQSIMDRKDVYVKERRRGRGICEMKIGKTLWGRMDQGQGRTRGREKNERRGGSGKRQKEGENREERYAFASTVFP